MLEKIMNLLMLLAAAVLVSPIVVGIAGPLYFLYKGIYTTIAIFAISGPLFSLLVILMGKYKFIVLPQKTFDILFFGTTLMWLTIIGLGFLTTVSPLETLEVDDIILFAVIYISGLAIVMWFMYNYKIQELEEKVKELSS